MCKKSSTCILAYQALSFIDQKTIYRISSLHSINHPTDPNHRIHLIEGGAQTPVVNLPNKSFNIWRYPPRLLLDARGRQHIIAMYEAGEQPNIRDYLVGSDDEPTIIRATTEVKGKLIGFQASQGSHGRMIALMQMNDTGNQTAESSGNNSYLAAQNPWLQQQFSTPLELRDRRFVVGRRPAAC